MPGSVPEDGAAGTSRPRPTGSPYRATVPAELLPLPDEAAVAAASGGDLLVCWAAQALARGGRAWARRGAVAVQGADLQRRDRLVVAGPWADAAGLVAALRWIVPDGLRLTAAPGVVAAAGVGDAHPLLWRETRQAPTRSESLAAVTWLPPAADPEVDALLDEAAPDSWGRPGEAGMRRYAGLRDGSGRLVAVAGEGWSASGVGFVAGVATRPGHRGRGLSQAVCAFVTAALVRERGAAALLHDCDNRTAAHVYDRLGYARRVLLAGTLAR
jgi:ribosomal protein S18 acetylase RimI-like enzyme